MKKVKVNVVHLCSEEESDKLDAQYRAGDLGPPDFYLYRIPEEEIDKLAPDTVVIRISMEDIEKMLADRKKKRHRP